jgi:hypothetical protein
VSRSFLAREPTRNHVSVYLFAPSVEQISFTCSTNASNSGLVILIMLLPGGYGGSYDDMISSNLERAASPTGLRARSISSMSSLVYVKPERQSPMMKGARLFLDATAFCAFVTRTARNLT